MSNPKDMPLDDFIALMLRSGRYTVDVETGRVTGPRGAVRPFLNATGYPAVNLVYSRAVVRRATVHRIVAIVLWGVERVRGKQVGHLDGQRWRSIASNLWLPETAKEHVYHDGTHRNLRPAKPKASWLPCVRCSEPNGRSTDGRTPDRISGARFGIDGDLCRRCYGALQERARRARRACHADEVKAEIERRLAPAEVVSDGE